MWVSEQLRRKPEQSTAEAGAVTIGGMTAAVYTDTERRGIPVYAPGGYVWRPRAGGNVLVLKLGDGELCAISAAEEDLPEIQGGEVCIKSDKAYIHLQNDGTIAVKGTVRIEGGAVHQWSCG